MRFWACTDVLLKEQKPVMCLKDKRSRNENVMKFNFELFVKKLTGGKFVARSVLSDAGPEFGSCAFLFCKLKGPCLPLLVFSVVFISVGQSPRESR